MYGSAAARGGPAATGAAAARGVPAAAGTPAKSPLWARLCVAGGVALAVLAGGSLTATTVLASRVDNAVGKGDLFGDGAEAAEGAKDLRGPMNILLAGIDPREWEDNPDLRADSVLVMHVPASLDRAVLFSLPRDLLVDIPAFPPARYPGGRDKLTHAMYYGSRVDGDGRKDPVRGFELLSRAVSNATGIARFDAGAIVTFNGFKRIVDALGGVRMYVDMDVASIHMRPDGKHRAPNPGGGEGALAFKGPRKQYRKGNHQLSGWEALDYTRQRYIEGGDYARQRHQQQFLRAMVGQALSRDVVTNPGKLDAVLQAAGKTLTFSGRGHSVTDFAFVLRNIRSDNITMVKLTGGSVLTGGAYQGEALDAAAKQFLAALRSDTTEQFLVSHPEMINRDR
ncbi:transcriptional regulator [Pilimelia terevasa]|uniref:Transcriptional regulator n=1 Tax=Pilimelia terevasa TaxID=53372 RepID=A0A8J3BJM2_9ACTN|nr:transcriptional regulator [Pilimelia terevasa]